MNKHIPIIVVNWFLMATLLIKLIAVFQITTPVPALFLGLVTGMTFSVILVSMTKTSDKYLK